MRNPLSAMLMCADGISDSLVAFQRMKDKTAVVSQELVESNLDAAQTIIVCAQHQKRIIGWSISQTIIPWHYDVYIIFIRAIVTQY